MTPVKWIPIVSAVALMVAASVFVGLGLASSYTGSSGSSGNGTDIEHISLSVGETSYSGVFNTDVKYFEKKSVSSSSTTVQYVPRDDAEQTLVDLAQGVKGVLLGELVLDVSSSENAIPEYTLLIAKQSGTMNGTFYLSVKVGDGSYGAPFVFDKVNGSSVAIQDPGAGVPDTVSVKLYVATPTSNSLPPSALVNVVFRFTAAVEVN